jgi:hypothetical protein
MSDRATVVIDSCPANVDVAYDRARPHFDRYFNGSKYEEISSVGRRDTDSDLGYDEWVVEVTAEAIYEGPPDEIK